MTLDETIKHTEEVARQNEEDAIIYLNCKNHKKNLYEIGLAENAEKECCKCAEEHHQLAEWLKELKQLREKTRWIPVSERLPEENEAVMASTEYGVFPEARYTKEYGWEWAYEAGADYWKEFEGVTAWMPLPKPYKAESEE